MIYRLFVIALILIISIKQSGNIVIINITSKNVTVKSFANESFSRKKKKLNVLSILTNKFLQNHN